MSSFAGKVALVTGGAAGIGKAGALRYAELGAAVVVADRAEDIGQAVCAEIVGKGGRALFVHVDVADPRSAEAMVEAAVAAFGGLDVAFNNAGIAEDGGTLLTSEEDAERLIAVNLLGVLYCMRAEIKHMLTAQGGVVVNTASRVALVGKPSTPVYSAAKHGVLGLTKSAAMEFAARNIRVNAICPGFTRTDLVLRKHGARIDEVARGANPMQRAGSPEEVAEAAIWLSSAEASFVTGIALPVDGGASAG